MLPKTLRLTKRKEFNKVFKEGAFLKGSNLVIKFQKITSDTCQIAVVVGLKVSKSAVKRHKIKRMIWASVKKLFTCIALGYQIIVLALPSSRDKESDILEKELTLLLQKAKILKSL